MSCSTMLKSNELSASPDLRCHPGLDHPTTRTSEVKPIIVQSSTAHSMNKLLLKTNPAVKRNLRDKRRSTGIRPDEVYVANTLTTILQDTIADDNENEENASVHISESNESFDPNQVIPSSYCSKSMFTVSENQSSCDDVSTARADSQPMTASPLPSFSKNDSTSSLRMLRPEEFILLEPETALDEDPSTRKYQQLEERIIKLESLVYDKDILISDLQRKLDKVSRELSDMEQHNYILQQEKLTLIKAFTELQDHKLLP